MADNRKRNFTGIIYPESAPENWREILEETHVPCCISPLHDKDVNPDGEPKKSHYHVVIMFEGKQKIETVQEIFDKLGGVKCQNVLSLRGNVRYLCHLDNPEKYPYRKEDVISLSGADFYEIINLACDKYNALAEMMDYCVRENVFGFGTFAMYCKNEREDWYRILVDSGTIFMKEFLKSFHWEEKTFGKEDESV